MTCPASFSPPHRHRLVSTRRWATRRTGDGQYAGDAWTREARLAPPAASARLLRDFGAPHAHLPHTAREVSCVALPPCNGHHLRPLRERSECRQIRSRRGANAVEERVGVVTHNMLAALPSHPRRCCRRVESASWGPVPGDGGGESAVSASQISGQGDRTQTRPTGRCRRGGNWVQFIATGLDTGYPSLGFGRGRAKAKTAQRGSQDRSHTEVVGRHTGYGVGACPQPDRLEAAVVLGHAVVLRLLVVEPC